MGADIIGSIRAFNRFYVKEIGLLQNTILDSVYTLTEAHIMNELHYRPNITATEVNQILQLDEGYLSRVIKKLVSASLIKKKQSLEDKRKYYLCLTANGISEHKKLDIRSTALVEKSICHLSHEDQLELQNLMGSIMKLLQSKEANSEN